jgi:hypothetical protein
MTDRNDMAMRREMHKHLVLSRARRRWCLPAITPAAWAVGVQTAFTRRNV